VGYKYRNDIGQTTLKYTVLFR